MGFPTYASREQFMAATDTKTPAALSPDVDRILQSASRQVERQMHRHFYPRTQTVGFKPRWDQRGTDVDGAYVWLPFDLLSISSLLDGSSTVSPSDYSLDHQHYEDGPYSTLRYWGTDLTITGVWGYSQDTAPAGALAEALDASETDVDVTDSSKVGVGDLIFCDSESMIVTEKSLLDTTADLGSNLGGEKSDTTVAVNTGSLVKVGEVITIDSERMLVISISGNNLTVQRAWDGSVLASHSSGASVYAPRTLTVEREAVGSSSSSHDTASLLTRNVPPGPIQSLVLAEALTQMAQENSRYARVIGSGENQIEASGKGLRDLRKQASSYKRLRMAAV